MLTTVKNWCGDRLKERTSWDGGMLVAGVDHYLTTRRYR